MPNRVLKCDVASRMFSPAPPLSPLVSFYRLFIAVVVLFWVTMWTLLVRSEWHPQETALRAVPLDLVWKNIFQNTQPSDLVIRASGQRIGHLRLAPRAVEGEERVLEYFGNLQPEMIGLPPQHASWEGRIEMDAAFAVKLVRLNVGLREPGPRTLARLTTLELYLYPPEQRGRYGLALAGQPQVSQEFTLNEAGLAAVMEQWGVEPSLLGRFSSAGTSPVPAVATARQAQLALHGEKVETFLVTIRREGQTLLEMHVSQLGQILQAKTVSTLR